ncbi:MAG: carbohydrate kinase family protein [Candidatus Nanohaloarchaea archaeon]|nr:carbohydrate kinase family protein [Candidatus Nanohaloarchaea archaeon]
MTDIIAFGELLVDLIGQEQGQLNEIETLQKRPGGAPANVAVAAARLGRDVRLIATVGNDSFGDFLIDAIERHGVRTDHIERVQHRTTLAFASLDEESRPDFMFYRDNHADIHIQPQQLDLDILQDADVFHFGSLSLTHDPVRSTLFHALQQLDDTFVSCDPNLRDDLWDQDLERNLRNALDHVDLLILAQDELDRLFNGDTAREQARNAIQKHSISEVAVTHGRDGAELHTADQSWQADALEAEVVDTTGAGDAFAAGYLDAWIADRGAEERLRQGNAVASRCVEQHGAMEALPTRDELSEVMQQ